MKNERVRIKEPSIRKRLAELSRKSGLPFNNLANLVIREGLPKVEERFK